MIVDIQSFIRAERPFWDELRDQLDQIENTRDGKLPYEDVKRFRYLYDRAVADLAKMRGFSLKPEYFAQLERLVARAYGEVHRHHRKSSSFSIKRWLTADLPQSFRRQFSAFIASTAIMIVGSLLGAGALALDPNSRYTTMAFGHDQKTPSERVQEERKMEGRHLDGAKGGFSAMLMTHNIRVSLTTLAMGLTYGVGSVILLFYNGVILGSVALDYMLDGQSVFLLAWLLPHGSVEIPAILIAGQGAFVLASALIGKGNRLDLHDRLAACRGDLVNLIAGLAILLVWAGIVEAFISQYHDPVIPSWLKIGMGTIQLGALVAYLTFAGRASQSQSTD